MVTNEDIREEWDKNAEARHAQLVSGIDISHDRILIPQLLQALGPIDGRTGLDVGCGSGVLTRILAAKGASMVGVDLSLKMIEIAKRESRGFSNAVFHSSSLESYARRSPSDSVDFVVVNMAFNCVVDLGAVIEGIAKTLRKDGDLVFTVAHPFFWKSYRGLDAPGTPYHVPHSLRMPFIISLDKASLPAETTYFHRPLELYSSLLRRAGFVIQKIKELMPPPEVESLYPDKWKFPRFVLVRSRLSG